MFYSTDIDKVIKCLIDDGFIPERQESIDIKEEVIKIVKKTIFDSLSENEKKFIKDPIFSKSVKRLTHLNFARFVECSDELYEYWLTCKDLEYYSLERVSILDYPDEIIPQVIVNWKEFKEKFPEVWEKEIFPRLMRFLITHKSYSNKVEIIKKVLSYKKVNLTSLKKFYPDLYKYIKN